MKLFMKWEELWRVVVFLLWLIALAVLLLTKRYTIFLRPEFGILLSIGILTLAGFVISSLLAQQQRPLSLLDIVRGGIILLPLAYVLASGNQLDSATFQNRFLGLTATATDTIDSRPVDAGDPSGKQPSGARSCRVKSPLPSQSPPQDLEEVTILDLSVAPQQYEGKRVSVVGMVARSEEFDQIFGKNSLLLFRFIVACCTADSTPAYALIRGNDLPYFQDDSWVRVQGIFAMEIKGRYRIPAINDSVMEKTEPPEIPYLY